MAAAVETMMYNRREVPWHGLGTPVDGVLTAGEAIKAAGLSWRVSREPIFTESGEKIEGTERIARDSDDKTLAVVGGKYRPIQNAAAFDFMDALVDSGDAKYETAGSLKGGRVVWILTELPEFVQVAGEDIRPYLLLSNSHDGSSACKVAATPVRVVCANTLAAALTGARRTYSIQHTGDVRGKTAEARRILQIGFNYYAEFTKLGETLAAKTLSDREFSRFAASLFPAPEGDDVPARIANRRAEVARLYHSSPNLENVRGTAWAAYNAAAEYADHFAEVRGATDDTDAADQRTYRAWFRPSLTDRALEVATAI